MDGDSPINGDEHVHEHEHKTGMSLRLRVAFLDADLRFCSPLHARQDFFPAD